MRNETEKERIAEKEELEVSDKEYKREIISIIEERKKEEKRIRDLIDRLSKI